MAGYLPWDGKFLFHNTTDCSREDRLKQRITRAIEKAQEDGALLQATEWEINALAVRLYDKFDNCFCLPPAKDATLS